MTLRKMAIWVPVLLLLLVGMGSAARSEALPEGLPEPVLQAIKARSGAEGLASLILTVRSAPTGAGLSFQPTRFSGNWGEFRGSADEPDRTWWVNFVTGVVISVQLME